MTLPTTYVGKAGEVRIIAEAGSNEVTIEVKGQPATMGVQNARNVVIKLRAALKTAEGS